MRIVILGWYGTETIGDRAILAGLISFFNKSFSDFEIKIGSLFPFFTNRTLDEDYDYYKQIVKRDIDIKIFNSRKILELEKAILNSDIVVMGGGPLMHLNELVMIQYAFKFAKKKNKKTAILGCGIGPLFRGQKYRKSVIEIFKFSDITILRDEVSKKNLMEIIDEFGYKTKKEVYVSFDPAVECAIQYKDIYKQDNINEAQIVVNLRDFPSEYSKKDIKLDINKKLKKLVADISSQYNDKEIILIPHHYFYIGGDDREFLNSIKFSLNRSNLIVQNINLSLVETMQKYNEAILNIGMRFHAVVLQTIVSGKNYILDYTEPQKGKIYGFIKDIDKFNFYGDKYIQLQLEDLKNFNFNLIEKKFDINKEILKRRNNVYIKLLKSL